MNISYQCIEKLFSNMFMLYGHRMDNMYRVKAGTPEEEKAEQQKLMAFWHSKLCDMTKDEFLRGVKALDRQEYPPTLPQFIKLCRPDIDANVAYFEAVKGMRERSRGEKGTWSHPAIFWAAASMTFDLLNASYQQIEKRWKAELAKQLEKSAWAEIPEAHKALPAAEADRISKEEAKQLLQKVGMRVPKAEGGDASWIKEGLDKINRGVKMTQAVRDCILAAAKAKGLRYEQA